MRSSLEASSSCLRAFSTRSKAARVALLAASDTGSRSAIFLLRLIELSLDLRQRGVAKHRLPFVNVSPTSSVALRERPAFAASDLLICAGVEASPW